MTVKASSQITLVDLTDGYSITLTNDNHTFLGDTDSVAGNQTTNCMVQALCGSEQVACKVGTITAPTGLNIVSDGKTPVPTLTITATPALTTSGTVMIPVTIGDITISKAFSYSIAFKGSNGSNGTSVTVRSTEVVYQISDSGTTTPTGAWQATIPSIPNGKFLWTRTIVTYSDGKYTTAYSISRSGTDGSNGSNGSSVTVSSTSVTYQVSTNGTSAPTGAWSTAVPSVPAGQFLWTKTVVTYSDSKSTISYSVSRSGTNGSDGSDALNLVTVSSNGNIFKNTEIATTLTAMVYKGGVEVSGAPLTALGTIKWYKDTSTTAMSTGVSLTIQAGDVLSKANYTAKLED